MIGAIPWPATPILNYAFTIHPAGGLAPAIGKTLISGASLDLHPKQATLVLQIQVEMMRTSTAGRKLYSIEADLFRQIATFSATGLVTSMALVIVGGFQIYPWF